MTRRIDPHEAKLVIAKLRAANPVPSGPGRPAPHQVDAFLFEVMERTDMVQDISDQVRRPERDPLPRRQVPRWAAFAAGFVLAASIAIPVLFLDRGPDDGVLADPALQGLSATQATLLTDVLGSVNTEDFDGFRSLFSSDGGVAFETSLFRPYHEGVEAGQPIPQTDEAGFEADFAWGAALDRRVSLRDCASQSPRIMTCDISFSLEALRTEWLETMSIALDEAGDIALLTTGPLDPDPVDRDQPLSLDGYYEFQDWLEQTHPDEYRRLVDPGTPGSINGVEIMLSLAPQNPDLVDDMTSLIDEYLATR